MNALPNFDAYISAPADHDDTASLHREQLLADQIRTSLDPMDVAIAGLCDALTETPEAINLILIAAHRIKLQRIDDLSHWDTAQADGMWPTTPITNEIRMLSKTGADDCRLGLLIREVTQASFALGCVEQAESEVVL